MIDVKSKSLGMMIDDLITTSMKLWYMQEIRERPGVTLEELGEAFNKIQSLNVRRNALINAIDAEFDEDVATTTLKTYK
jgi:hypothetical protein